MHGVLTQRTAPPPAWQVTPDWERLTAQVEADEELKKQLGWVRRRRRRCRALLRLRLRGSRQTALNRRLTGGSWSLTASAAKPLSSRKAQGILGSLPVT